MKPIRSFFFTLCAAVPLAAQFTNVPGSLTQISAGSDGTVWGITPQKQAQVWNGTAWTTVPGTTTQVAVGNASEIWGLDTGLHAHRWNGTAWTLDYGPFVSISVGSNGATIAVDPKGAIYQVNPGATLISGSLVQASMGDSSNIMGVDSSGKVYKWTGTGWQMIANGPFKNVQVNSKGTAVALDSSGTVWKWNGTAFVSLGFTVLSISIGDPSTTWVVWTNGTVGRGSLPPPGSTTLSVNPPLGGLTVGSLSGGTATVGSLGSGTSTTTTTTTTSDPTVMPAISFGKNASNFMSGTGSLNCSNDSCSTQNADWVGAYKASISNTQCGKAHWDPIYGGTCWICPDPSATGTNYRTKVGTKGTRLEIDGYWYMGLTVGKDDSCHMVAEKAYSKATFVKGSVNSGIMAWDCASGTFWDMYDASGNYTWWGGSCWQCPTGYPTRTGSAVYSTTACMTSLDKQYAAARLVSYQGCPTPDVTTMGLPGRRLPGKPFLDIAGGWSNNAAAGGCYACPATDNNGNILVAERNTASLIGKSIDNATVDASGGDGSKGNAGCTVKFSWKPGIASEPGLGGLQGIGEFIQARGLLDTHRAITAYLYANGQATGATDLNKYVADGWTEIKSHPYQSKLFKGFLFSQLADAASIPAAQRTNADAMFVKSFEQYVQQRRTYVAQEALSMYDSWKVADDAYRASHSSSLGNLFYFGTVPLDFKDAAMVGLGLGSVSGAAIGATAGTLKWGKNIASTVRAAELAWMNNPANAAQANLIRLGRAGNAVARTKEYVAAINSLDTATSAASAAAETKFSLNANFEGFNALRAFSGATGVVMGAALLDAAFAVLVSIAIDQFIEIETARTKLATGLRSAQQPVDLTAQLSTSGGLDAMVTLWGTATSGSGDDSGLIDRMTWLANQAAAAGYPKYGY